MRNFLFFILVATLSANVASAEPAGRQKTDPYATSGKLLPIPGNSARSPCAAYGPGFAKVDGIDTCVKIGGSVSVGVRGGSR